MDGLNEEALALIYAHCEEDYPEEACGFVFASGLVSRASNIQNVLHLQDPIRFPRTARTGYTMSINDIVRLEASFRTNDPVRHIYHSHPDVGAYFSTEDEEKATYAGIPLHPVEHIVVDVRKGGVKGANVYKYVSGKYRCTTQIECNV